MAKGKKKIELLKSTAQQLGSVVKSCRDIMRKDKGLSGDLDRLPMLTWIMFLKFLDDMEEMRREEASLAGKKFRPAMEAPYRWRDWAAKTDGGMTGPELIAFINQEEAVRPDGKKGAGLFAYLRSLQSTNGDRRDVIAKVFEGTVNRMVNGYLLRDVVNKVNEIHFASRDEIHTLGHLYESMLKEMRDAAGDSGEFYTPRPLVKFIVTAVDPKLGETVLDPAAGTGGFLVEAFEHLNKQAKKAEDFTRLQKGTLHGIEPKPLPYLLCQMNLLLHGVEYPEIDPGNALRFPLREIGDKDRVDVIMTNPPFGGEEERGILSNFPEDKQTAETALLFLQLIMRKLYGGMEVSETRRLRQLEEENRQLKHAVAELLLAVSGGIAVYVKLRLEEFHRTAPSHASDAQQAVAAAVLSRYELRLFRAHWRPWTKILPGRGRPLDMRSREVMVAKKKKEGRHHSQSLAGIEMHVSGKQSRKRCRTLSCHGASYNQNARPPCLQVKSG